MVTLKQVTWECPYCYDNYDTEDEAIDCATDCCLAEMDQPIQSSDYDEYICDYCQKSHKKDSIAKQCEEKHIKKKDLYYETKKQQESFELLAKAASHPTQKRLFNTQEMNQ